MEMARSTAIAELVQPMRLRAWGWPAVINFVLGGTSGGLYLAGLLWGHPGGDWVQRFPFEVLPLLLGTLGFVTLTAEAGRPLRGVFLLGNLRGSWMSLEVLAGCVFVLAGAMATIVPYTAMRLLAGVGAAGLLVSQGFILYHAKAMRSWSSPLTPVLFATSGLASGFGLALALSALLGISAESGLAMAALILAAVDLAVWLAYLFRGNKSPFSNAMPMLRRTVFLFVTVGIGRILPVALISIYILRMVQHDIAKSDAVMLACAGLLMIVGNITQKTGIMFRMNYTRAVVPGKTAGHGRCEPERGNL